MQSKTLILIKILVLFIVQATLGNETQRDCSQIESTRETTVSTTEQLQDLRNEMKVKGYDAYIIPSADPHLSEYLSPPDKKREWISGFTGSAGTAVVTLDMAGLD